MIVFTVTILSVHLFFLNAKSLLRKASANACMHRDKIHWFRLPPNGHSF